MGEALLGQADLMGANLKNASNLTQQQIDQALMDQYTKLPKHLRNPQWHACAVEMRGAKLMPSKECAAADVAV